MSLNEAETRILSYGAKSVRPEEPERLKTDMFESFFKIEADFIAKVSEISKPYIFPSFIISDISAKAYPEPDPISKMDWF